MKNNYLTNLRMSSSGGMRFGWFFIGIVTFLMSQTSFAQTVCSPELKFTVQSTLNTAEGVDDATMRITGLDPAVDYVVAYELGTSFTGSIANGVAYSTLTNGVIANNLVNPTLAAGQEYVVRVYLPDNSCYAEKVYVLPKAYFNDKPDNTDLEITMTKSADAANPGDIVTVTVVVTNNNSATDNPGYNIIQADNVEITVTAPGGGALTFNPTATASQGTYDGTSVWSVGSLAPGQTETLVLSYTINERGIYEIASEVTAADGDDLDSSPSTSSIIEDDYTTQCLSTPFDYCDDDEFEFRLANPAMYSQIRYLKNGTPITITAGQSVAGEYRIHADGYLIIESVGTYSYESTDPTACGFEYCCPIIVEEGEKPDLAPVTPVSICFESPIADVVVIENMNAANDAAPGSDFDIDRGNLVYQWFSDGGTGNPITGSDSLLGYTSLTLNFDALPAAPGTYTYRIVGMDDLHQTCKDTTEFVVVIQDIEKPIAAANSPICEEETLELTTTNMADYQSGAPFTFTWWNENANGGAWTATGDSVGRTDALPAMSDEYIVEVSVAYTNFTPAQTVTCSKTDTVTVLINPLPPLPDPIDYVYCQGVTNAEMDSLRLNNEDVAYTIRWYHESDTSVIDYSYPSVRPFPSSLTAGSDVWQVSFYNEGTTCESHRADQTVTIDTKPDMPVVNNFAFCEAGLATDLTAIAEAGHSLIWYATDSVSTVPDTVVAFTPPPSTATVGITSYFVSQYNTTSGCQSFINEFEVHILDRPDGLAFAVPEYCVDQTTGIQSLDNHLTVSPASSSAPTPSTSYSWDYPGHGTPATPPTPTTTTVGATYGTVTEIFTYDYVPADNFQVVTIDCPSDVLPVHVVVNPKPAAEVIAISALCIGDEDVDNGTLILTRYENTDVLEWNRGAAYSNLAADNYIIESPVAEGTHGGVFASTLPNPDTSQDYFVRITNIHGCQQDIPVTLDGKDCICPGGYCEPASITPNF
ncbi:hypothetical protein SAMN06298216_3446 [Spirosomataceae bacterium TFI 002]|nr:hypothetical protein SAMN06298216_3446 [Spirosomataceae bacterium TFI 002]